MAFNPGSGGHLGARWRRFIDSTGTASAPTGDGYYEPENHRYGNGLIGDHLEGDKLVLKDWFIPSNWFWLRKRDLDMQVTPAIFPYKGKEPDGHRQQGMPGLSSGYRQRQAATISRRRSTARRSCATRK